MPLNSRIGVTPIICRVIIPVISGTKSHGPQSRAGGANHAANPILKTMTTHAAGVVGGPGSRNEPVGRILACCRLLQAADIFNQSGLDFLRGHPGRKGQPDIHDDGHLA